MKYVLISDYPQQDHTKVGAVFTPSEKVFRIRARINMKRLEVPTNQRKEINELTELGDSGPKL